MHRATTRRISQIDRERRSLERRSRRSKFLLRTKLTQSKFFLDQGALREVPRVSYTDDASRFSVSHSNRYLPIASCRTRPLT